MGLGVSLVVICFEVSVFEYPLVGLVGCVGVFFGYGGNVWVSLCFPVRFWFGCALYLICVALGWSCL